MRDNVDILKYWIKEIRKVKEFQEIAKVENIEFARLYGATERALRNFFIGTADEYGIARLEKIVGIYPDPKDTLESRRNRLYVYWADKDPYTEIELARRLEALVGAGNYEIDGDYDNYLIHIVTYVGTYGLIEEIAKMLDYILPANLITDLQNYLRANSEAGIYCAVGTGTAMEYTVTNDIKANYPIGNELYVAAPMQRAESYTITNDINSDYELREVDSVGGAVSTSMIITTY